MVHIYALADFAISLDQVNCRQVASGIYEFRMPLVWHIWVYFDWDTQNPCKCSWLSSIDDYVVWCKPIEEMITNELKFPPLKLKSHLFNFLINIFFTSVQIFLTFSMRNNNKKTNKVGISILEMRIFVP